MNIVILVDHMPEDCAMCDFLGEDESCYATGACDTLYGDLVGDKPDWCPLHEMPNKIEYDGLCGYDDSFADGYNTCIDNILGN